jgi:hypothetical protein
MLAASGLFRPFDRLRTGCGSKEEDVSFFRFWPLAAKNERSFLLNSFDVAALSQHQTKK